MDFIVKKSLFHLNFIIQKINIAYNDVHVSRIGITHKFLDFDAIEYHHIILEEKQNGASIV